MKVKRTPEFLGATIEITLESQQEANAMYCLFCHTAICDWLRGNGIDPEKIRNVIPENDHELMWSNFVDMIKNAN